MTEKRKEDRKEVEVSERGDTSKKSQGSERRVSATRRL